MSTMATCAAGPLAPAARSDAFEAMVRRVLDVAGRLTGFESTYLTAIDFQRGKQEVVYARNAGRVQVPEGVQVDWADTLCRRALASGPAGTDDVPAVYPDHAAARDLGIRSYLTVPVHDATGDLVGTLCGASAERVTISRDAVDLMETLADMIRLHVAAETAASELEQLALTDPVTLLPNRRWMEREIHRVTRCARQHEASVSILVIDIDRFKKVNDDLGHDAGDGLLRAVAAVMRDACRSGDVVGRWGGDEFVVVAPGGDEAAAAAIASRIQAGVRGLGQAATVSVGAATATGARVAGAFAAADSMLLEAKAGGRDRLRSTRLP